MWCGDGDGVALLGAKRGMEGGGHALCIPELASLELGLELADLQRGDAGRVEAMFNFI